MVDVVAHTSGGAALNQKLTAGESWTVPGFMAAVRKALKREISLGLADRPAKLDKPAKASELRPQIFI